MRLVSRNQHKKACSIPLGFTRKAPFALNRAHHGFFTNKAAANRPNVLSAYLSMQHLATSPNGDHVISDYLKKKKTQLMGPQVNLVVANVVLWPSPILSLSLPRKTPKPPLRDCSGRLWLQHTLQGVSTRGGF